MDDAEPGAVISPYADELNAKKEVGLQWEGLQAKASGHSYVV